MQNPMPTSLRQNADEKGRSQAVRLRSRGVLTLPKFLRDKYDLGDGDALYRVDAGGAFVLTPMEPMVPSLSAKIEKLREEEGVSIEELIRRLQSKRAALTRERYGEAPTEDAPRSGADGADE